MSEKQQLAGLPEGNLPANSQMVDLGLEGRRGEDFSFAAKKMISLAMDAGFLHGIPHTPNWYSSILIYNACLIFTAVSAFL